MEDQRTKSLLRLLEAAKEADPDIDGAAAIARALNTSDQVLNHWKTRGVPHAKTVLAQKLWGISAEWISTGEGDKWLIPPKTAATPGTSMPVTPIQYARNNRTLPWPFSRIDPEKVAKLDQIDVISLEGALLIAASQLNLDVRREPDDSGKRAVN